MRARARKLAIGVVLVVAFTLLVLQPFLSPINAQTETTLPSSSGTSVVESKDWLIKPKLANGTVSINATPEVIITINNTQAIATPAPFDQFINITLQQVENALGTVVGSYLWSQAMSHDFLNVIFVNTSSGEPLYAWVQNFTSNWVAVWLKLPNGVPAHGAVNITMMLTNASQYPYTGIYSAIYKGYDNGNYTFVQYGYFNDTVPSWWKTGAYSGSFSPTPTTSGLELLNDGFKEGTYVYASIPSLNGNYTVIVSWWYSDTADALDQELYGSTSELSQVDSIGSTHGGYTPYAANGMVAQNEFDDSAAYIKNASTYEETSFDGQGTHYITTYFAIQGNTQYYGYSNHTSPFQITLPSSFVTFHLLTDKTAPTVFIGAGSGDYGSYIYLDTVIVIPTPPNNVMPSVAILPGIAGQYIAWGYKPVGNTLNITIQIRNYTTGIHGFPGLVIYSANMGNYTSDNSTSGFSAILVSFTGAVAYHPSDASTYTFINTSAFPEPKPPFNMTVTLAEDSFGDTSVFKIYINKTVYILNVSLPLPWSQIGYIGLRADPDNNFTSTDPTVTAYNMTVGATSTITTTTTTTKTIANTTITSTTTTTTTTTLTTTSTVTATTTTTTTLTTTSTVTATKVATTTTTSTVTSTVTTAVTTVYVTTTITSTVTVKSATSSGLSLSSIYVLVAVVTILVAIPAGIMASRSTAQDSGRRYVQKA
jgi:hypothetical protein